jgi:hypothetical protein
MYLRIPREPIDDWADAVWAAATRCGAPMVPPVTSDNLGMVYLSGLQLNSYGHALDLLSMRENSFKSRGETGTLRRELTRCSNLIVLSTNIELVLVSNRSAKQYEVIENIYESVATRYDSLRAEVFKGIADLIRLSEQEEETASA